MVVPIYNDAYLAPAFLSEVKAEFQKYLGKNDIGSDLEVIFVDDGSKAESGAELDAAVSSHNFAKVIHLSRNFGQHIAVSCGYKFAGGVFTAMLNVDLEDPPTEVVKLLDRIQTGDCDIVHGLYEVRHVSFFNKITSLLFGNLLNKLTGFNTPLNSSTVRVMNRNFLDAYNSLCEKQRYIPGLEMWRGYRHVYVPIQHRARREGRSSYNFFKRLRMAVSAVTSFSDLPLKIISIGGLSISIIGILMALVLILKRLLGINIQPGYTSTVSAVVLMAGVQIFVTGVSGIYIGRILHEVQGRPLYLIRETKNLDPRP